MGKILTWLLRLFDVYQAFAWLLGSGFVALIASLVSFYYEYNILATFLIAGAILLSILSIPVFLFSPPKGSYFPRYRYWYEHRLRKISWKLSGVQIHDVRDGRTVVGDFWCSFRVNRGQISPERFVLEFDGRTIPVPVKIRAGTDYMNCSEIEHIPKGIWNQCTARILADVNLPDNGVTNHPSTAEFMSQFGPFYLVFEFDGKTFRRRYGRYELDTMIQGQINVRHPPVVPVPTLKDDNGER